MKNNQKNQKVKDGRGGKREGAGRPLGATNKPKLSDHLSAEEIELLVSIAKRKAEEGDTNMMKFILEQIFGRARQNIGLDGGEDGKPIVFIPSEIAHKNDIGTENEA